MYFGVFVFCDIWWWNRRIGEALTKHSAQSERAMCITKKMIAYKKFSIHPTPPPPQVVFARNWFRLVYVFQNYDQSSIYLFIYFYFILVSRNQTHISHITDCRRSGGNSKCILERNAQCLMGCDSNSTFNNQ